MKKTNILAKLTELELTPDLQEILQQELVAYPEELSQEDINSLDVFLQDLQVSEIKESQHVSQLSEYMIQTSKDIDQNLEEFTYDSMKAMKTGLSQAQDLAEMAG